MARAPENPQNGENVHGFQVRTPICHIVPVSRAYAYIPLSWDTASEAFPLAWNTLCEALGHLSL